MKRSFEDLVDLMRRLRSPEGCPWDREQTYTSLRPYVIEEAYEVVEAIDREDRAALAEEIGDMLLQAVFLAQLSAEEEGFTIEDSITAIHDKLVRRHPHVFGDVTAESPDEVLTNWERLKSEERRSRQEEFFSGIPRSLPGLLKAVRITEKAARVGFDWRRTEDIFAKLDEEFEELRTAIDSGSQTEIEQEIGDLLFTVANVARRVQVDAENALQETNRKFMRRFQAMERRLANEGRSIDQLSLEEMDRLWEEVKREERTAAGNQSS